MDDLPSLDQIQILLQSRRYADALAAFHDMERRGASTPDITYGKGICLAALGRTTEARAAVDRLKELGNVAMAHRLAERITQEDPAWLDVAIVSPPISPAPASLAAARFVLIAIGAALLVLLGLSLRQPRPPHPEPSSAVNAAVPPLAAVLPDSPEQVPDTSMNHIDSSDPRELWKGLEIEVDGSNRTFTVGDVIWIEYYIRNGSGAAFPAPKDRVTTLLHTLQRLDGDGIIEALPQGSKYTGLPSRFGYNLRPRLVTLHDTVEVNQRYFYEFSTPSENYLPGSYRLYIDLRLFDKQQNVLEKKRKSVDFTLVPARDSM